MASGARAATSVYALTSKLASDAVELYVRREDAERALAEAIADEPEWADVLAVAPFELAADRPAAN